MTELHRSAYWMRFTRKARPILAKQLPLPCVNPGAHISCTGVVMPGDRWHVSHLPGLDYVLTGDIHPSMQDVGPAHWRCNLAAGGRVGQAKQAKTKSRETRHLPW